MLFQDPLTPDQDCSFSSPGPSKSTAINLAPEEDSAPVDSNEDNVSS